ncbi:MAG TPA: EamA family transporter [Myxococcaceae bacterium]|nr:EamA family transporter [Myxococcaceae bacterium]
MLAVLLALGAAFSYGVSDFLAGWLSRRAHYGWVGLISQLTAAVGASLAALVVGGAADGAALGWGAFSGLGGGLGTLALYRGLARGRMSVVAPLSGVLAAGLPALFGLVIGERPSVAAASGLVLSMPAVWLVSSGPSENRSGPKLGSVIDGVLAGVGFAVLFIGLQRAGRGVGLWPSAASQLMSALVMVAAQLITRTGPRNPGEAARPPATFTWVGPIAIGLVGTVAVICYYLATTFGLLSVVAVLTSLYPAVTVALARWLLAEPIARRQGAGLALAGLAVALISAG